jgi:hypothetical protein
MSAKVIQFPCSRSAPTSPPTRTLRSRVDELQAELNAIVAQGAIGDPFVQSRQAAIDNLFASLAHVNQQMQALKKHLNALRNRYAQY